MKLWRLSPRRIGFRDGYVQALDDLVGGIGDHYWDRTGKGEAWDAQEMAKIMFSLKRRLIADAWNGGRYKAT